MGERFGSAPLGPLLLNFVPFLSSLQLFGSQGDGLVSSPAPMDYESRRQANGRGGRMQQDNVADEIIVYFRLKKTRVSSKLSASGRVREMSWKSKFSIL